MNYFDMPMVDYTHVNLAGAPVRYSVALLKTYHPKKTADIVVSILPTADYSADNRYVFDEAVRKILNPDINKSSVESSIDDGALSVSD